MKKYTCIVILILTCVIAGHAQTLQDGFYISTDCSTGNGVKRFNLLNLKHSLCLVLQPFQPLSEIIDVSKISYADNVTFFDVTISEKAADQIYSIHKNITNGLVAVVVSDEVMFVIPPETVATPRRVVRMASRSATAAAVYQKLVARIAEIKNTPRN